MQSQVKIKRTKTKQEEKKKKNHKVNKTHYLAVPLMLVR